MRDAAFACSLAARLAKYAILIACGTAFAIASLQVWREYEREVQDIARRLDDIERTHLPGLAESAWHVDRDQFRVQVEGIARLPGVTQVAAIVNGERLSSAGQPPADPVLERRWPLVHRYGDREVALGEITVQASLAGPREHTLERVAAIALATAVSVAVVTALMFLVVHRTITRHLKRISSYVATLDPASTMPPLELARRRRRSPDELDQLVRSINETAAHLRASQDEMRLAASVYENAAEGIMITDRRNSIVAVNAAFTEITGYAREEVIGKNPRILRSGRQSREFYDAMWASIGETGRWQGEIWDRRKDGRSYCERLSITTVRNEQGEIVQHCAIFSDVTDVKLIEAKLVDANARLEERVSRRTAELEQANRELEAFSYSVSHDLRGPLRRITGFSTLVLEMNAGRLDATTVDYLERVVQSAVRMGALTDDLLTLARASRHELKHEEVDLTALARQVAHGLAAAHPERKVRVRVEPGMRATGDASQLRIMLENLLDNAWKFTAGTDAPAVHVGCRPDTGETAYFVRDNGAGFDMKYAHKLFQPFQRLHAEEQFKGTGIGLSIVQRIVARHGGRVWAEAQAGKGAAFYFALPRKPPG